jgi:hypothetical protein
MIDGCKCSPGRMRCAMRRVFQPLIYMGSIQVGDNIGTAWAVVAPQISWKPAKKSRYLERLRNILKKQGEV